MLPCFSHVGNVSSFSTINEDFAWNYNGFKLAAASPRGAIHVFSVQGRRFCVKLLVIIRSPKYCWVMSS